MRLGVNVAVRRKLAPGFSLIGKLRWLKEKALPCWDLDEIRSVALPEFESVKV